MKSYTRLAIPMLAMSLALGGCTSLAQTAGSVGQSLSTASPTQAATLADALQAATITTDAVNLYVTVGNPNRATLDELNILNEQLHAALTNLQRANAAGQSLTFAAFNEAYAAFQSYATARGVKH